MQQTIGYSSLNKQPTPETGPKSVYKMCPSVSDSNKNKPGVGNQDCAISIGFVGDGISQYPDSQIDSKAVARIFSSVFGCVIRQISKAELDDKLAKFNQEVDEYTAQSNIKKLKTTYAFFVPFIEDEQEKLCIVSKGDSVVLGYNKNKKCQQLNLNSHPLFENVSKQNISEFIDYAIYIQQTVRDNNVKYTSDKNKSIFSSSSMISSNRGENFEEFIDSIIVSAKNTLALQGNLNDMQSTLAYLENLQEPSRTDKINMRKLKKNITTNPLLESFIKTKEIRFLVELYAETMNVVSGYQTTTYQSSEEYSKLLVVSDGVTDNLTSETIGKILETQTGQATINQMIVEAAKNSNIKPDDISSCLVDIRQNT